MLPRHFGKSHVMVSYITWHWTNNINETFFVWSQNAKVTKKYILGIKNVISSHPFCVDLLARMEMGSKRGVKSWNNQTLRFPGTMGFEDNFNIATIGSSLTGARAEKYILDDIETRENVNTEEKRRFLKEDIISETLLQGKWFLYVGHPGHQIQSTDLCLKNTARSVF